MSDFFDPPCDDNIFQDVETFMKAMGQECRGVPLNESGTDATLSDSKMIDLYDNLVTEEYEEFKDAPTLTDTIDAICDSIWVMIGLAAACGVRPSVLKECWDEVYRSNMDKLNGPIAENGKRLKPEGWQGPRIAEILERHRKAAE